MQLTLAKVSKSSEFPPQSTSDPSPPPHEVIEKFYNGFLLYVKEIEENLIPTL
jgi:hypothetical protein